METKIFLDYIRKHVDLSEDEEALLVSNLKTRKYLKGQYVVQQGDICRFENFVISGCLKTFYIGEDGQEHVMMFAIENWWTADLGSFITQTPADYTVQCIEDSVLIQLSFESLEQLYIRIPKLERFFRIIIQKAFVAAQKRLVNNFSLAAKQRYLLFREQYPLIEQRVPQYLIASYLGITREFLSKIRNQLIIDQPGH
jgi:CRP-like cAMP-binding protein